MIRDAALCACLILLVAACTGRTRREPVGAWVRARLENDIKTAFDSWAKNKQISFTFAMGEAQTASPGESLTIPVTAQVDGQTVSDEPIRMRWDPDHEAWVGYFAFRYADAILGRFGREYEASYGLVYGERPRLMPGARAPQEPRRPPPAAAGTTEAKEAHDPDGIPQPAPTAR